MPNTPEMARFWEFGTHLYSDLCNGADHETELKDFLSYIKTGEVADANADTADGDDPADAGGCAEQ